VARRQIGDLRGDIIGLLEDDKFGGELALCFQLVRESGAKLQSLAHVRQNLLAETPINFIPTLIVQVAILFCISNESILVVAIDYKSRDDVEAMMRKMQTAFSDAKEDAADSMDSACYQSLVSLASSVILFLADQALVLPRMITFNLPSSLPTLRASHMIYYDASRSDELIAENKIVHPAFAPRFLKGLSQ